MAVFKALRGRLKGARGIEYLALAVIAALAVMALLNGGVIASADHRTPLERRMESVLGAIDGAGRVRVLVSERDDEAVNAFAAQNQDAQITGVLVVAEGAASLRVRMELARAVQTLLNVELEDVEIIGMRRD